MNKQDLVNVIATQHEITKKQAQAILETVVDTIVAQIVSGDKVTLTGLGTFDSVPTAERNGRNPTTGEALTIPASKKPTFKFTSSVKVAVKATV